MIIREQNNGFIMIKQHDHAQISSKLYQQLPEKFLPKKEYQFEVNYAIEQHDCGWIPFDETPFWNDKANEPYSFTNFPTEPKTVLYEYGINRVEEKYPYAALLCSEHYTRFLRKSMDKTAKNFVQKEQARQERILKQLNIAKDLWMAHYEILQFFDNLSLYICLNEPGTPHEEEFVSNFSRYPFLPSISGTLFLYAFFYYRANVFAWFPGILSYVLKTKNLT